MDAMTATVTRDRRLAARSLVAGAALAFLLAGCYFPTQGIRDPNPGPGASPPWPYEEGMRPSGAPPAPDARLPARPAPGYARENAATPPPPSQSVPPQYADWLFDGPEGRGFAYYLAQGYRRYAKHEDNAHDFEDAAKFLFRASAVERGEIVEPEQLGMRTLPAYAVDDLLYARQRLMQALGRGAAQRLPKLAASAQVAFDCWMEQQEENSQPHDVARCRRDFEALIVRLEGPPEKTVACPPAACPASAPCAAPACDATPLVVHFDLDKHGLSESARAVLRQAADLARRSPGRALIVTAHADRAGSDSHNDALSKRRLDTVLDALAGAGVPREQLARAEHFGETRPRLATADGVRAPENRRVEIRLSCEPPPVEAAHCAPVPATGTRCPGEPGCAMPASRGR